MSSKQMTLKSVRIENLRAIQDQTIRFGDYTAFVGPNGAGKSTVLFALNVFFQETQAGSTSAKSLSAEDFHNQNTSEPIRITVTFGDLSPGAREEFKHYVRSDILVITAQATFDPVKGMVQIEQKGQRLVMSDLKPYFEADRDGKQVAELRLIYKALKAQYSDLPTETTKQGMQRALREYEEAHSEDCTLEESSAQFYGISRGSNKLEQFVQWIYVPAVKEVTTEQQEGKDTALGKVLERTVRASVTFSDEIEDIREAARKAYDQMLTDNKSALSDLEKRLSAKLSEFAHPDCGLSLEWSQDSAKSISVAEPLALAKVHEFGLQAHLLGRCGHGLQRSFLLALLQILASAEDKDAPTLLLGIEEAELFQHPPQARHLAGVLQQLADGNSQVLLTTHSPYFVSAESFEAVRLTRRTQDDKRTLITEATFDDIATLEAEATGEKPIKSTGVHAKLAPALLRGLNEMFFARCLVLVEGIEDVAYIESHAILHGYWEDFRRLGILVLPVHNKSNLMRPIAISTQLKIPFYVIYDSDGNEKDVAKRGKHEKDNLAIQRFLKVPSLEAFPDTHTVKNGYATWTENIEKAVMAEFEDVYQNCKSKAEVKAGQVGELNKNPVFVGGLLTELKAEGKRSALLDQVCENIITRAQTD